MNLKQKKTLLIVSGVVIFVLVLVAVYAFSTGSVEIGGGVAAAAAAAVEAARRQRDSVKKQVEEEKNASIEAILKLKRDKAAAEAAMDENLKDIPTLDPDEKAKLGDDLLGSE